MVFMGQRIEHPRCTKCSPERSHPEGAPHFIDGAYFEERGETLAPLPLHEAKAEHRRASVRAAVRRLRAKSQPTEPEQTEQAA